MQGEVTVPYTSIGGTNMDSGIMMANLSGSSAPGIVESEFGTTLNVRWIFPGGISGQAPGGVGWGYALGNGIQTTDDLIKQWLMGVYTGTRELVETPQKTYTEDQIADEDVGIVAEINRLMEKYAHDVMTIHDNPTLDYHEFSQMYSGCVIVGK